MLQYFSRPSARRFVLPSLKLLLLETTQNVFVQFRLCLNHVAKLKSCGSFDLSWLIKLLGHFATVDAALRCRDSYREKKK